MAVTVESLLVAIFCAGVIFATSFIPFVFALWSAWKKADEQVDNDTQAVIWFAGVFFFLQIVAMAVGLFVTNFLSIVLNLDPQTNLSNAFALFWSLQIAQLSALELQSLGFIVVGVRGFFTAVCVVLPLAALILVISLITRNIIGQYQKSPEIQDFIFAAFKTIVYTSIIFVVFVGWSYMVQIVISHPQGLSPYEIGQQWWRETIGINTHTVQNNNLPQGMSAGEALRKGMLF